MHTVCYPALLFIPRLPWPVLPWQVKKMEAEIGRAHV